MNSIMGGNRDKIQMANLILVYRGLKIEKNDEIYFILDIIKNRHNITDCPYFRSLRKEFPSLKPVHISKEISQTPLDVAPVFDRAKIKHVYMNKEQLKAQLKAAAWALVALLGAIEAMRIVQGIAKEIEDSLWEGPGNR